MSTKKTAPKTKAKSKPKPKAKAKTKAKAKEKLQKKELPEEPKPVEVKPDEKAEKVKELEEAVVKEEEVEEKPKEAEKKKLEKKEEEEDIVEERVYTVPLGRVWISPRKKHSPKAIRMLRAFVMKHMKVEEGSVRILNEVNEKVWSRGIEKPPRKIRVRVTKDSEGIVTVRPAEGT